MRHLAPAVAVLLVAGCSGGQGSSSTTPASTVAGTTTSTVAGTTSSAAASTSLPASTGTPSAPRAATTEASADPFVREVQRLVPHADAATATDLRTMICDQLAATPSSAGVQQILSGLVEQSGLDRDGARSLVRVSVRSGCPSRAGLVG